MLHQLLDYWAKIPKSKIQLQEMVLLEKLSKRNGKGNSVVQIV